MKVDIDDDVDYITFKKGVKVHNVQQIGFTSDKRLITLEKDKVGSIIGIELS
jgi:hypothetical protein